MPVPSILLGKPYQFNVPRTTFPGGFEITHVDSYFQQPLWSAEFLANGFIEGTLFCGRMMLNDHDIAPLIVSNPSEHCGSVLVDDKGKIFIASALLFSVELRLRKYDHSQFIEEHPLFLGLQAPKLAIVWAEVQFSMYQQDEDKTDNPFEYKMIAGYQKIMMSYSGHKRPASALVSGSDFAVHLRQE